MSDVPFWQNRQASSPSTRQRRPTAADDDHKCYHRFYMRHACDIPLSCTHFARHLNNFDATLPGTGRYSIFFPVFSAYVCVCVLESDDLFRPCGCRIGGRVKVDERMQRWACNSIRVLSTEVIEICLGQYIYFLSVVRWSAAPWIQHTYTDSPTNSNNNKNNIGNGS